MFEVGRNRLLQISVVFLSWHLLLGNESDSLPCSPRSFGSTSVVCVCNATFCDTVEPIGDFQNKQYIVYTSTMSGKRLEKSTGQIETSGNESLVLTVNSTAKFQRLIGFGGAVTDSAGINILSLSNAAQEKLLQSYYSSAGIEYNVIRIPMGSCDFSTHPYSYDDSPLDFSLTNFSLQMEDLKYKIPIVNEAQKLSSKPMTIFGSPWSAPAWMKTDDSMVGKGSLIGQPGGKYYKTWANYFVRFLQEYLKHNITIWGLTAQNEPADGRIYKFPFQCMGWTAEMQRDFIAMDLGPALHQNGFSYVKLMILDDQRIFLPKWAEVVLSDPVASSYVSGIGIHWYLDFIVPPETLGRTHAEFSDKFIFSTEACNGDLPWEEKVILGSWERGESYAHDIISVLNYWVSGWTDWNIALDMEGGPNWVKNFVDSPVIVNADKNEFYKQPTFYVMGHFSKFLVPDSLRLEVLSSKSTDLIYVGVMRPDKSIATVVLNRQNVAVSFSVYQPGVGYINRVAPPRSIQTILWRD